MIIFSAIALFIHKFYMFQLSVMRISLGTIAATEPTTTPSPFVVTSSTAATTTITNTEKVTIGPTAITSTLDYYACRVFDL